jgi:carotenoid 1,2-hydratase
MFRPNPVADAWHEVTSPGGYEWWYFDAEDPSSDTQVVAIFLQGFVFHPGYLRKYARYRRRPTRHTPPVANDFVCAYFVVYRNGRIAHQFMTQYPADSFAASRDVPGVTIGDNRFWIENNVRRIRLSGTPWKLTFRGPLTLHGTTLSAEFSFKPLHDHPAGERAFFSRQLAGADHHWVIADPLCEVTGEVRTSTGEQIAFQGRGYHDHNYGTGPIGPGLKRWFWGRALLDGAAFTFQHAVPRDRLLAPQTHCIESTSTEQTEFGTSDVEIDWSRRTPLLLKYPARARFGDVLTLDNPRVLDSAPFYLRVMYDAVARGRRTTAFTEVAYPHRLRYPILGRMIEMSIDKRG